MKKLIIDRNFWLRGEGESYLHREHDDKMCCLGFLGIQCGIKKDEMTLCESPANTPCLKWPDIILNKDNLGIATNSDICESLIWINDCKVYTDKEREQMLIDQFRTIDYEVEFIN